MLPAQFGDCHASIGLLDEPDDLFGGESTLLHIRPLGLTDFTASAGTAQWGQVIVAQDIKVRGTTITLSGLSVCNGCQSLLAFYENRKSLTDKLEVLVRIVKVGDDRKLPEIIAYRTNNQNAISLRDLNSNDSAQLRIKAEFDQLYGNYSSYSIKRGETVSASDLKNEEAGRMLLALYLKDPTSTHQKYKIFSELEPFIFSIDTTAPRIRLSQILCNLISQSKNKIESE